MRTDLRLSKVLACIAVAIAGCAATTCAAREARQWPVETGLIAPLINNPVCGSDETFDAWPVCAAMRQRRPPTD